VADRPLTGILLVGGASRRFGSPKALATFDGETLAERAWRTLRATCDTCIAVGKAADALPLPFALLDDGSPVRAPLAGIVAGLRAATSELTVVLPVDVPLVRPTDLRALADACLDAAVPFTGPLPCALRRTAAPTLEAQLADGRLALKDAFAKLETRVVALDGGVLANVNTPADLDALRVRIVPYHTEHRNGFHALVADTLREYGFEPDAQLDPDLDDPSAVYEALWVALVGDEVVGAVALRSVGPREVQLKRMYLRPQLRGRGVGRKLLQMALVWSREHRIERISLDTTKQMEAARHLYETHGFVRVDGDAPRQGQSRLLYELRL
jgi:molybdopterin-guanine dinucleotide biosynthesis protein A/N-acetylglutamate synthase-like GNAT family acetyltransferase